MAFLAEEAGYKLFDSAAINLMSNMTRP